MILIDKYTLKRNRIVDFEFSLEFLVFSQMLARKNFSRKQIGVGKNSTLSHFFLLFKHKISL
jgi:hypothetical protein